MVAAWIAGGSDSHDNSYLSDLVIVTFFVDCSMIALLEYLSVWYFIFTITLCDQLEKEIGWL
jgi:hypothetical protein